MKIMDQTSSSEYPDPSDLEKETYLRDRRPSYRVLVQGETKKTAPVPLKAGDTVYLQMGPTADSNGLIYHVNQKFAGWARVWTGKIKTIQELKV